MRIGEIPRGSPRNKAFARLSIELLYENSCFFYFFIFLLFFVVCKLYLQLYRVNSFRAESRSDLCSSLCGENVARRRSSGSRAYYRF